MMKYVLVIACFISTLKKVVGDYSHIVTIESCPDALEKDLSKFHNLIKSVDGESIYIGEFSEKEKICQIFQVKSKLASLSNLFSNQTNYSVELDHQIQKDNAFHHS